MPGVTSWQAARCSLAHAGHGSSHSAQVFQQYPATVRQGIDDFVPQGLANLARDLLVPNKSTGGCACDDERCSQQRRSQSFRPAEPFLATTEVWEHATLLVADASSAAMLASTSTTQVHKHLAQSLFLTVVLFDAACARIQSVRPTPQNPSNTTWSPATLHFLHAAFMAASPQAGSQRSH